MPQDQEKQQEQQLVPLKQQMASSYHKVITSPEDHPLWAELFWAYSLCAKLHNTGSEQQGPVLSSEGCARLLKGHGQPLHPTQLAEALNSWGVPDTCGGEAKTWLPSPGQQGKKKLLFVDFLAVLLAWRRRGQTCSRLHYFRRWILYDLIADWVPNRTLWVGMFLCAFLSLPHSALHRALIAMVAGWTETGRNKDWAEACAPVCAFEPRCLCPPRV